METLITLSQKLINNWKGKYQENRMENTINQHGITDVYKTLPQTITEYTYFSSVYGINTKRDNIVGKKTSPNLIEIL